MYLLDTNVVSELRKARLGKADAHVVQWADSVDAVDLYLSAISLQELEIGILLAERRDPTRRTILRVWLNSHVLPAFTDRILPVDTAVALRSARLHVPDPLPVRDGLIAATALIHGMTLVTRNTADFETTGVKLFNPWSSGEKDEKKVVCQKSAKMDQYAGSLNLIKNSTAPKKESPSYENSSAYHDSIGRMFFS